MTGFVRQRFQKVSKYRRVVKSRNCMLEAFAGIVFFNLTVNRKCWDGLTQPRDSALPSTAMKNVNST